MHRQNFSFARGRGAKLLITLCLLVALGAGVVGAREWLRADSAPTPAAAEALRPDERQMPGGVLLITVRPERLSPDEITVPKGLYRLAVENRSGLRDVTFRLDREAGGRVHEQRQDARGPRDWGKTLDLTPGTYVLSEAGHPEWTCRITVTPR